MEKKIIEFDFDYYKRTIEKIYKDYYKKRGIFLSFVFIILGILSCLKVLTMILVLPMLLTFIGIIFIIKKYSEFSVFLKKAKDDISFVSLSEDASFYYVSTDHLKFKKKNVRNLPSEQKEMTFFIGTRPLNIFEPIHIKYYDMLDITYTDQYKLRKTKVSFGRTKWKFRFDSIYLMFLIPIVAITIAIVTPMLEHGSFGEQLSSSDTEYTEKERHLNFTDQQLEDGKMVFWEVVDTSRDHDLGRFYKNMRSKYIDLSEEDQYLYSCYKEAYVDAANSVGLDMACKLINGSVSDDTSLYFYLWVISQGETVFLDSLKDPDTLSNLDYIPLRNANFEEFLYVENPYIILPNRLEVEYKKKVSDLVLETIEYKTGDRYGGFTDFQSVMEASSSWLPNLTKRVRNKKSFSQPIWERLLDRLS